MHVNVNVNQYCLIRNFYQGFQYTRRNMIYNFSVNRDWVGVEANIEQ